MNSFNEKSPSPRKVLVLPTHPRQKEQERKKMMDLFQSLLADKAMLDRRISALSDNLNKDEKQQPQPYLGSYRLTEARKELAEARAREKKLINKLDNCNCNDGEGYSADIDGGRHIKYNKRTLRKNVPTFNRRTKNKRTRVRRY